MVFQSIKMAALGVLPPLLTYIAYIVWAMGLQFLNRLTELYRNLVDTGSLRRVIFRLLNHHAESWPNVSTTTKKPWSLRDGGPFQLGQNVRWTNRGWMKQP